ncbi:MAG: precorrin-6A/cobalt-precorrin-6A reductase, partial [Ruminiclostridium sp.]|nr:precorrin-6A/cobalt-precorrin-6A reductase [Ruminiclostridium sp.]
MKKILIFGGTTEGRLLAEWCGSNGIAADVSVTTEYGAELLTKDSMINVLTGKLGCPEMKALITAGKYAAVVDATHPYASEATANIRKACEETGAQYCRLLRGRSELYGKCADNMTEIIRLLNDSDAVVLSTLGSKELPELSKVHGHRSRMWLRLLPADG